VSRFLARPGEQVSLEIAGFVRRSERRHVTSDGTS